jgi:hypothetical protein
VARMSHDTKQQPVVYKVRLSRRTSEIIYVVKENVKPPAGLPCYVVPKYALVSNYQIIAAWRTVNSKVIVVDIEWLKKQYPTIVSDIIDAVKHE